MASLDDDVEVIDAHHHFVDPERIDYHFVKFLPELARFLGTDELAPLLRDAGVTRTVVVQAHDGEDETRFMAEQAKRVDWVAGIVGWVPLADPAQTAASLDRHTAEGTPLRGIRHLIHDEPDPDWVVQPPVLESLSLLAEREISFDLSAFQPRHIEHVVTFAERVPELDVVICHLGMPRTMEGEWEPWAGAIRRAALNPRCHVKLSGWDMYLGGCGPEARDRVQRYVDHCFEGFGAERTLWSSNWPVSLRGSGYRELLEAGRALCQAAGYTDAATQRAIFGGNARRVYRLD